MTGLYAKGGSTTHPPRDDDPAQDVKRPPLVNLLRQRESEQIEDVRLPIPEIKIRLGVWGCQFVKEDGEKEHEAYFVFMVSPVL